MLGDIRYNSQAYGLLGDTIVLDGDSSTKPVLIDCAENDRAGITLAETGSIRSCLRGEKQRFLILASSLSVALRVKGPLVQSIVALVFSAA